MKTLLFLFTTIFVFSPLSQKGLDDYKLQSKNEPETNSPKTSANELIISAESEIQNSADWGKAVWVGYTTDNRPEEYEIFLHNLSV
jgi:hypothetical protein